MKHVHGFEYLGVAEEDTLKQGMQISTNITKVIKTYIERALVVKPKKSPVGQTKCLKTSV